MNTKTESGIEHDLNKDTFVPLFILILHILGAIKFNVNENTRSLFYHVQLTIRRNILFLILSQLLGIKKMLKLIFI